MDNQEKNNKCADCRFFFKRMNNDDVGLIRMRSPQIKGDYHKGQKLCIKKDIFVYEYDYCGCFRSWD